MHTKKIKLNLLFVIAVACFASTSLVGSRALSDDDIGSLDWTIQTGGALSGGEKVRFIFDGIPGLLWASIKRLWPPTISKVNPSTFLPPESPIVRAAMLRLKESGLDISFINHSIRTACWTVVILEHENPHLSQREIEEAWLAGLMHDIGLALFPPNGEFTLGGVSVVSDLVNQYGWSKDSERKVSEAITLNPNSRIDKKKYGLAWAMNVGGMGETFYGPYRILMNSENVKELEKMYPRDGFYNKSAEVMEAEIRRFPNQRFELLKQIGFLSLRRKDG